MNTLDQSLLDAAKNNAGVVRLKDLLSQGADVNAKGDHGFTALMYAAFRDNADSVGVLITVGADVKAKDVRGWTAINYAKSDAVAALLSPTWDKLKDGEGIFDIRK